MKKQLASIDVSDLDVYSNDLDLLRDLHVFVKYAQEREVKRLVRSNRLSKADNRRLAQAMTDTEAAQAEIERDGYSHWLNYVDRLALRLRLINYDTEGEYLGYTSRSPSYRDNYVIVQENKYRAFIERSPLEQEKLIFEDLLVSTSNEFYSRSICGRLDRFQSWGSATKVMSVLKFPPIRKFLFKVLQEWEAGAWYSVASLVEYLKYNHRYFLIPEQLPPDKYGRKNTDRYGNFYEGESRWDRDHTVSEEDPDAFERVEGRYVERFLEGIPLLLHYVDVAYDPEPQQDIFPSRGVLKGFRIREHLHQVMNGELPEPNVTVQPNFEVVVESPLYPAALIEQLSNLAEQRSEKRSEPATIFTLKLQKERVAKALLEEEELDVLAYLESLTGRPLPQNIRIELQEWTGHADVFTLYDGFALFEGDDELPEVENFTVAQVAPNLRVVHSSAKLITRLERAQRVPFWVEHPNDMFDSLPERVRTSFPTESETAVQESKPAVTLQRRTTIVLHVSHPELFKRIRKALVAERCPIKADSEQGTLTYSKKYTAQVEETLETMRADFEIEVEEVA